jgi:hypothetical protein
VTSDPAAQYQADLVNYATSYAQSDFPVFPVHAPLKVGLCDCSNGERCQSPGKHPRTANGFKDATTDELTIRRWWKEAPRANVAIAVPSGYVVLDIDGQEGIDALAEAGYVIPDTPTATTGKGWHHWFTTNGEGDLPPRAGLLPKVDLRGPGSYVVAPPSLHITGRQYRWTVSPTDREFAPCPSWLRDLAAKSGSNAAGERVVLDMASILAGVPEGQRDSAVYRAAAKLRYADVPYDWAVSAVEQAAANCQPPLDRALARSKVDAVYGKYQPSINLDAGQGEATLLNENSVRVVLTGGNGPVEFVFADMEKVGGAFDAELTVQMMMPGTAGDSYVQRINLLSHNARDSCRRELESIFGTTDKGLWAKLLNRAITQAQQMYLGIDRSTRVRDIAAPLAIEYVVDGVVPEGRPTIGFGAGSASKTFLAMSMALAVARGEPWLGRKTQKRNVLLIDYETGKPTVGYRFGRLARALGMDEVPDNIHTWWADGIPLLDQTDAIRRSIERNNIGFLLLDHCAVACGGEPERSESALRFHRAVSKLGLPMFAIAHVTGDAETNPDLVKRPFGSIFWSNGCSMTWYIRREDQEEESDHASVGLFARKYNDSARPRDFGLTIDFYGVSGPITIESADLRDSTQLVGSRGKEYVLEAALDYPMTIAELEKATGINGNTIKSLLRRNAAMFESIEPAGGGRGKQQQWQRRGVLP